MLQKFSLSSFSHSLRFLLWSEISNPQFLTRRFLSFPTTMWFLQGSNHAVIWDRIIKRKEDAHVVLEYAINKYGFREMSKSFKWVFSSASRTPFCAKRSQGSSWACASSLRISKSFAFLNFSIRSFSSHHLIPYLFQTSSHTGIVNLSNSSRFYRDPVKV